MEAKNAAPKAMVAKEVAVRRVMKIGRPGYKVRRSMICSFLLRSILLRLDLCCFVLICFVLLHCLLRYFKLCILA